MHGLNRIIATNAAAAAKQLASKSERPETFARHANNGNPIPTFNQLVELNKRGMVRFPPTAELAADRRPAPHGDPLTAAHEAAKDRQNPEEYDGATIRWYGDYLAQSNKAAEDRPNPDTNAEHGANPSEDFDRGFTAGYDAAIDFLSKMGLI